MPKEHPKRAASNKSQCLGFSKEHRRCRLERDGDSKTCSIHRNYYRDWWTTTYRSYGNMEWASPRQRKEYEFHLCNNYIQVPEWYFARLKKADRNEYLWLIRIAKCNPLRNRELFYYIITAAVDELMTYYAYDQDRAEKLAKEIQLLLQTSKCCQEAFSVLVFRILFVFKNYSYLISEYRHHRFWNTVFTNIQEWSQLLKSPKLHDCLAEFDNKLLTIGTNFLNEEDIGGFQVEGTGTVEHLRAAILDITRIVNDSMQVRLNNLRNRGLELKRELAAIAFAPERVARLLDAGYEIEDI